MWHGASHFCCAAVFLSVIGTDGEALACKIHIWLSRPFPLYSESFLNPSVCLIGFCISPNISKRKVSLCPAAGPHFCLVHRQLRLLLPAALGRWNLAPHIALWCGIGTRRMLPSSNAHSETMKWNAESRQGQDGFHSFCASASLLPSCSNYCSSAQINNCTSKPLELMNSGPRANLSRWSFATDFKFFKWDWDRALQPSPVLPLFTPSCAAHVQLAGSCSGFGTRHCQVRAPEVALVTSQHSSPPTPWPYLSSTSCSSYFMAPFKR